MEYTSSLFSLVFLLVTLVSLYWGYRIIKLSHQECIHKAVFSICIALGLWSLGFSLSNAANTLNVALFWRRFAALGWTSIFSIILHSLLLLTENRTDSKIEKKYYLLHIPAIVFTYVYAVSNSMAAVQYNLVKIDFGWTNIALNNTWDYFYYFYYAAYMLASLLIVWKWKGNIEEKDKKNRATLIFVAVLITSVLGALNDLVANSYLKNPIPQMAPLFILIPVGAMYYFAKNFNLLNIEIREEKEVIISRDQQKMLFNSLSSLITIGAIFILAYENFSGLHFSIADLENSFKKISLLIALSITLLAVQEIKKESTRDKVTLLVLVSSVPMVTFQFLNYSTITVWVYPLIIIISSLLYNKRTLLISTTVVSIITQKMVWIFKPESYVMVNKYDYIFRIMFFVVACILGSFINKSYIAKTKEIERKVEFQKMVSEVLIEFVGYSQENFNEKIDHLLEKIGKYFDVDKTYLFTINHSDDTMTYSNEWCNKGVEPSVDTVEGQSLDASPWWISQLNKNHLAYIEDVDFMSEDAQLEQVELKRKGVRSLLSVPVIGEGKMYGFLGIQSESSTNQWLDEKIELLNIMSNILSGVLTPIQTSKETEFMAYYDSLTKLPNRYLFEDKIDQAIYFAKRNQEQLSIIFVDLDNFKSVNDSVGHRGGDVLLKYIADKLSGVIRKGDILARFGGDEFMILVKDVSKVSIVIETLGNIMRIFSEALTLDGQKFLVTASVGVSMYPADGEDADELIKSADIAMFQAKTKGKNQYAICTQEMKDRIQLDIDLSDDLVNALENEELEVYYQPQIDLLTKKITGVEALLRWMHPSKGVISPGVFIPLAEKNDLINSIGEWVIKTACLQNKKWQDMGLEPLIMAINLSAKQMINPNISSNIKNIIEESGLEPKYIELEITESVAIEETDYVIEILDKLKKTGVSITIDDFGTEYSSLARLKQLPVDRIKIDLQFVQGIEMNEKDRAIIKVIINLAKSLGLNVLAEGVETVEQLEFLQQNKCDYVQGYYYHKPLPALEIEKLLKS